MLDEPWSKCPAASTVCSCRSPSTSSDLAMTREEAERECARRAEEDPERSNHTWFAKELTPGSWTMVKADLPPVGPPSGTETRADERPPTPDDPRTSAARNAGVYASA